MKFILIAALLLVHEWYPQNCCSDKDCRPVPCEEIHSDGDKWEWHKLTIDKFKTQVSPDGKCHVCPLPYVGILLCVFMGGEA
jgi:hypothetical protein